MNRVIKEVSRQVLVQTNYTLNDYHNYIANTHRNKVMTEYSTDMYVVKCRLFSILH